MAQFPAASYISDSGRTKGEAKVALEAIVAAAKQIPGAGVADLLVTIAGGSITPAGSGGVLSISNESAAAADDLTNIIPTNYPDGSLILLRNTDAAEVVTIKHAASGTGQIFLDRSADYVLDDELKYLLLHLRGTDWYEVFRGPSRLAAPVVTKSSTYTVTQADHGKVLWCTGAGMTVNLLAAAAAGNGFTVSIRNANSLDNGITIDPNGSETLDSRTTVILYQRQGLTIVSDGSNWHSVGSTTPSRILSVPYATTVQITPSIGDYWEVGTLTGNVTTLDMNGNNVGGHVRIRFQQDGTGGRTVANPSGSKVAGSLASAASQASFLDLTYTGALRWEGFWTQIPA